jgi:hypothetical protein
MKAISSIGSSLWLYLQLIDVQLVFPRFGPVREGGEPRPAIVSLFSYLIYITSYFYSKLKFKLFLNFNLKYFLPLKPESTFSSLDVSDNSCTSIQPPV